MQSVGIDLGKRQSDVCILAESGEVLERFKLATTREALTKRFGGNRSPCKIAIEACRDSGWVYRHLTELGHEVVVVDTTKVRSIGVGQGRRKTDRRDAEALARALHRDVIPRAHVLSEESHALRKVLHARDQLVSLRTRVVTMLRGQFQSEGHVVASCEAERFAQRLRKSGLPGVDSVEVQAMLKMLDTANAEIETLNAHLSSIAERQEPFERFCSVPGVKLIVSLAFIAAIDAPQRFRNAHQVQAYLGLVPSESSTGGKQRRGGITCCGNKMARSLLIQAVHSLLRTNAAQDDPLVVWAKQLAERRGKRRAVVAVARRLAGVLWAMWMDGTFYDPKGLARQSRDGLGRRARIAKRCANQMARAAAA